jgi:hypothetical protein
MFDRIKERHGLYASWAVWAPVGHTPKSNIGDMRVLDPDQNPKLLQILRTDLIMVGLNISRPVPVRLRNFHDPNLSKGQDFKIRYAFAGTPYYGAYMTDFIKWEELESKTLMRYLRANPSVVKENLDRFLAELNDIECDRPTILAFGGDAHELIATSVSGDRYSRLVSITHYSHQIGKEEYRKVVLEKIEAPTITAG